MKKTNFLFILLYFCTSLSAHANFNTDAGNTRIVCKGTNLKLSLNANRSAISILTPGDDGHVATYRIVSHNSDGDSFVMYKATSPQNGMVNLVFADRGAVFGQMADALQFGTSLPPIALSCSKN